MKTLYEDLQVCDVTIVGDGPGGLFAAFYAGMQQMGVKICGSSTSIRRSISRPLP